MIFEVTPGQIVTLSDTSLRELIGFLAERELTKAGYSTAAVTYGGHQNAPDGGIDVRVALTSGEIDGYVPRPNVGFQAKAEDFSPSKIKLEMCPDGKLRNSIRELIKAKGAYIIVSSKGSASDASLSKRKKAMMEAIGDEPDALSLHVDFYDNRRIASWVNQHPGLIPWVRDRVGQSLSGWRSFQDWSSSPDGEAAQYILDDGVRLIGADHNDTGLKAEDGVARLRAILDNPRGVVRLVGLSGVGKTRMVQALFDVRVGASALDRHLAVYADIADNPDPVPAELLGTIQSLNQRCVLIVDNCGSDLHQKLVARLSPHSLVSLITVEYDISDDAPEKTNVFKLEPASSDVIEKVLKPKYPDLTEPEIHTIAIFSEGNFRVALALASTSIGGQSLANLNDKQLFNRLFRQKNEENPALLRGAKACSLVYSFDVETIDESETELPLLATLAKQPPSELYEYVAELKRRQLVQARARWRAILPHALAHRLAKLALEDIPPADLKTFVDAAPERLLKSFSRRLGCLHDSNQAQTLVDAWLSTGGMLSNLVELSPIEMVILNNIAPVNPQAVVNLISRAHATSSNFFVENSNSEGLSRLLRSIAYDPSLFDRAVGLIAHFAQFKTESNNMGDAVNVFKSLFFLHLSGTHARARQRADLLRSLAHQGTEKENELVLVALDAMLECSHFSSSYGFEFGARRRDYGYHPSTWGEIFDWYSETLQLANDLSRIPPSKSRVRTMIASQFVFLARRVRLDDLIGLAEQFVHDGGWAEGWVGVRGALREAKEANHTESVIKLEMLKTKLTPRSLSERIASYVLPSQWGRLDLAELEIDDDQKFERAQKKIDEICEAIGAELAADLESMRRVLPELLASSSQRVFTVAKSIGRNARSPFQAWHIIEEPVLESAKSGTIYSFPGAFLAGLADQDRDLANEILDGTLSNPRWHPFLPHMQSCVGIDSIGCSRLIAAIPLPSLPVWTLRQLSLGRATDEISSDDFKVLLSSIAAKEGGLDVATDILHMRVHALQSDGKQITGGEREIARELLQRVTFEKKSNTEPYRIKEIVRLCLDPNVDEKLARSLCRRLYDSVNEYKASPWDYGDFIAELAALFPRVVLEEALEPSDGLGEGRRNLFSSFREHRPCPLRKIDDDRLLSWAHEKPDTRFVALASSIVAWRGSKTEQGSEAVSGDDDDIQGLTWTSGAWRLIREAPEPISVLEEFRKRFSPSGWSGSLASIIAGRLPLLEKLAVDADKRVADWAIAAVPTLQAEIESARAWEAGIDRERDERFDW